MSAPSPRPAVIVSGAAPKFSTSPLHMMGVVVPSRVGSRLRSNVPATADVFVDIARGLVDVSATAVAQLMTFALAPVLHSPDPLTTPARTFDETRVGGEAYALAYQKAAAAMAEGWAAALEVESESYAKATTNDEAAVTLRAVMHAAVQDMELALADIPPYCEGRA